MPACAVKRFYSCSEECPVHNDVIRLQNLNYKYRELAKVVSRATVGEALRSVGLPFIRIPSDIELANALAAQLEILNERIALGSAISQGCLHLSDDLFAD